MMVRTSQGRAESERRMHIRYAAGGLEARLPGSRELEVVDLSTGGLAVATSERMLLDNNYSVHLRYRTREIEFPCKVAWCRLASTRKMDSGDVAPWYVAGLTLRRDLGEEGRDLLGTVQQLAVTTLPVHISGRIHLQPRSAPGTHRWCNLDVLRISQKGLFCELGTEPLPFIPMDMEIPLGEETLLVQGRLGAPAEPAPEIPGLLHAGVEFWHPSSLARKTLADYMAAQLSDVRPARQMV